MLMLFFDLDGTLFDHKSAEKAGALGFWEKHRDLFDLPAESFLQAWSDLTEKYYQLFLAGKISFREQRRSRMRELYSQVGLMITDQEADLAFETYLKNYQQAWTVFSDVVPCLTELQGIGLGVISNGDFQQQAEKLTRVGIMKFFSVLVTSSEVGFAKPDKRIFWEACWRAKQKPAACFYVGDLLNVDFMGSTAAGMKGILLNRSGEPIPFPGEICIVENLLGLRTTLEKLRTVP